MEDKMIYKGYEITYNGRVYLCEKLTIWRYKYSDTLRGIKKMIRREIAEAKFKKLREMGISMVDVFGGKMWHSEKTNQYSFNVHDFAKGFSGLNEFTYNRNFSR